MWKKNYVLSKAIDGFASKLAPKFIPCVVTKVISDLVYQLRDRDGDDLGNWHVADIKPDVTVSDTESEGSLDASQSD